MSEKTIDMTAKIDLWEERVNTLRNYANAIDRLYNDALPSDIDDIKFFEHQDKLYDIETEIYSKEQYIKTYKEDIARQEQAIQRQTDTMATEFGKVMDKLKKMNTKHPKAVELRNGILDRVRGKKYDSHQAKWQDFVTAQEVIAHIEANPTMQPAV